LRFRFCGPLCVGGEGAQYSQRAAPFEKRNIRIAKLGTIHDSTLVEAGREKSPRFLR
jgi:hypothetical protein